MSLYMYVQGRYFFACNAPRNNTCKFFKWADDVTSTSSDQRASLSGRSLALNDSCSIEAFVKGHGVEFYCGCEFLHKVPDALSNLKKAPVNKLTNTIL